MGRQINFKYKDENDIIQYSKDLYVPKKLVIDTLQTKFSKPNDMTKWFYKVGNTIHYNKDDKNPIGMYAHLIFRGDFHGMTFSELQSNRKEFQRIEKFVYLPQDNGKLELPESIFDGIPHGGYLSLFLRRGNSEMFKVNGMTHKISTGNQVLLSLILKR